MMAKTTTISTFFIKHQEFILLVGLILWLSIFHITETKLLEWSSYLYCALILGITLLPALTFALNKTHFRETLTAQHYTIYWCACFLLVQPVFTAFCISLAPQNYAASLFIEASVAAIALEFLLILNFYYQKKAKEAKWLKKISLEKAVFLSLVLISLIIAAMGTSSLNNPEYHSKERLLIGFEFSLTKIVSNFGMFLSFFIQFLFMYLCGYLFFIINSRILVSHVLKQKGFILYGLSVLATIAILYPLLAQLLISLPINETLGRDIFSDHAFDLENAFGVLSIMLISLPIVLAMQWGKQNTHILSLEKEKSQTELDLLKQQLNPHFFFNTLNNLYGLSLQHSEKTSDSILRLSELMRYTIYKGQEDQVKLVQELNYLEDYIELQQIRLKKPLKFSFNKEVSDDNLQIAPLLLIVLIENAFKHGIEPAENEATLSLVIKSDRNQFYFSCENSIEQGEQQQGGGIGLVNLKKRLNLLYPNKHTLTIDQNKDRYRVELEISL